MILRCLEILNDGNTLKENIGMNEDECTYFVQHINEFIDGKKQFETWFKSLDKSLYEKYWNKLQMNGIFGFASLHQIISNKNILGNDNVSDAKFIFNHTPKNTTNCNV